jgi:hypothetical protein
MWDGASVTVAVKVEFRPFETVSFSGAVPAGWAGWMGGSGGEVGHSPRPQSPLPCTRPYRRLYDVVHRNSSDPAFLTFMWPFWVICVFVFPSKLQGSKQSQLCSRWRDAIWNRPRAMELLRTCYRDDCGAPYFSTHRCSLIWSLFPGSFWVMKWYCL